MDELVSEWTGDRRFDTLLLSVFALIAVLLAGIGVYGVVAHSVSQRTPEIGVRMAVGARWQDVLALIFREVIPLILAGDVAGVGIALASGRVIASQLYQRPLRQSPIRDAPDHLKSAIYGNTLSVTTR